MNDQVTTRKDHKWIAGHGHFQSAADMAEALEAAAARLRQMDGPLPAPMSMELTVEPAETVDDADDALDRYWAVHRVAAALGLSVPVVTVSPVQQLATLHSELGAGVLVADVHEIEHPDLAPAEPAELAELADTDAVVAAAQAASGDVRQVAA